MKINLSFAELHTPLFLGGKNFGLKLYNDEKTRIDLQYDQAEKELWVTHNGKTAIIPTSNVVSMTPLTHAAPVIEEKAPQVQTGKTQKFNPNPSAKAQVSTPTSHVFGE